MCAFRTLIFSLLVQFVSEYTSPYQQSMGDALKLLDPFHQEAFDSVTSGDLENFQVAVNRGFEPDYKNPYRIAATALHLAAERGFTQIVKYLIEIQANVNARDDLDRTPLHLADNEEVCRLLVESGADIEAPDFNLWRPLHFAVKRNNAELVSCLLQTGADVNAVDLDGNTPCHLSADYGRISLFKLLLPVLKGNLCNGQNQTVYDLVRTRFADHKDFQRINELLKESEDVKGPPFLLETLPEPRKLDIDGLFHLNNYPAFVGGVNPEPSPENLIQALEALDILIELEDSSNKEEFLVNLLKRFAHPLIHWVPDGHLGCEVAVRVQTFVNYLLKKAAEIDPRFAGLLEPMGSSADGSKLGKTDEFDFLLAINELGNGVLDFRDPENRSEGFVKVRFTDNELRNRWKPFLNADNELDYLEVNNYFRFLLWETSRRLKSLNKFGFTFRKVLVMGDFDHKYPKHALPLVRFMPAGCKLLLHCQITGLWIEVDVVPGIKVPGWPEQHTIPYKDLRKVLPDSVTAKEISFCIVPKTHSDTSAEGTHKWQLSFSTTEKMILSRSGESLLNALRILKILKTVAQEAKVDKYEWLSSYVMKTGFLHYLASIGKGSPDNLTLTEKAIRILQIIREEVVRNTGVNNTFVIYSFFVPRYVSSSGNGASEFVDLLDRLIFALTNVPI